MTQRIKVPQQDSGEITLSRGGSDPIVFAVQAGIIEAEDSDVDILLRAVPGAQVVADKPSAAPGSSLPSGKIKDEPQP